MAGAEHTSVLEGLRLRLSLPEVLGSCSSSSSPCSSAYHAADHSPLRSPRLVCRSFGLGLAPALLSLPLGGQEVKEHPTSTFWVDNTMLQAKTLGVAYRLSKDMADRDDEVAPWGCLVEGLDCGDGWLAVEQRFLPIVIRGVQVLILKQAGEHGEQEHGEHGEPETPRTSGKPRRTLSSCSTSWDHHDREEHGSEEPDLGSQGLGSPTSTCLVEEAPEAPDASPPAMERLGSWSAAEEVHGQASGFRAHGVRRSKGEAACEDAFFVSDVALGVADGVGGMAQYADHGVDVAAYAAEIMQLSEAALQGPGVTAWQSITAAEVQARSYGASTAMVVRLAEQHLDVAGLGDSGMLLLRPIVEDGRRQLRIVGRSVEQQHSWNYPYQLARLPEDLKAGLTADCPRDTAELCLRYEFPVLLGDLVLVFSDGFSDNVFDRDVLAAIEDILHATPGVVGPEVIAEELVRLAWRNSMDNTAATPWAESALKHGECRSGGKIDDITVVAAWVVDKEADSFD